MKIAGIVIIFISTVITGALLEREAGRGSRELSSFISFLEAMRTRLECYLDSPRRIANDYKNPLLEETGFLRSVRDGKTLHASYIEIRSALSVAKEADKLLSELFASFGRGYLSSELRSLEGTLTSLKKIYEREAEKDKTRGRALKITVPTLGMGLVILLI